MLDNSIADRLRSERRAKGLSQTALAKKAGVAQATISGIEIGRYADAPTSLYSIAEALNVSVEWLRSGALPKERGICSADPDVANYVSALDELRRLAPSQAAKIEKLIDETLGLVREVSENLAHQGHHEDGHGK